jgi:hypothetical protein
MPGDLEKHATIESRDVEGSAGRKLKHQELSKKTATAGK